MSSSGRKNARNKKGTPKKDGAGYGIRELNANAGVKSFIMRRKERVRRRGT